jgi:copper(I)-binding protein
MRNHQSPCRRWLLTGLLALATGCSTPTDLQVSDAYIKLPVPGRQMTAAYATFTNHTNQSICLTGFSGSFANSIELHATKTLARADGSDRVRMIHLPELCIEPGTAAILAPGGKHLMIMGVHDLSTTSVNIEILSSTGTTFATEFEVQAFNYVR